MTELRIVIADDHEVVRAGLRALVEASPDMRVVGEAVNGQEVIERARELRPHVVVMDVAMPVLDGAEATEWIVRELPEVKVLALTAHGDRASVARLLEAGATGYILKGAVGRELVDAIRSVACGTPYVDSSLAGVLLGSSVPEGAELSDREEEVLRRTAWGDSNKKIATELGISTRTVETYKARIGEKLGLKSRGDMIRYALKRGWMSEG
jgi:DNA-binding NarL/FixJ family response regulator